MRTLIALLRKHFSEAKWGLALSMLAFFAFSILTVWLTLRAERVLESGDFGPNGRRLRLFQALGAKDFSSLTLEICFWNFPLITLTVLGWAIGRGASPVAGEIERGTLDLILSRPVSRSLYLLSHVTFTVIGLVAMAAALIAGNFVGSQIYTVKSPPGVLILLRPALMLVTFGMAAYAYTLPFSAIDIARWRPSLIASAVTFAGIVGICISPQFEEQRELLERVSIFWAYTPITVSQTSDTLAYNAAVLLGIFATGLVVALIAFSRRDLPTNS
ncbi:permease [Singulisphaera sp. PoT]|uniref:permease n=1 Tax=Singulisphaera sp. PoT TaxID=3411797 RepID=UPI003BF45EDA